MKKELKEGTAFIYNSIEFIAHSIEYDNKGNILTIEDFGHNMVFNYNLIKNKIKVIN
jgi:hypothetical protein